MRSGLKVTQEKFLLLLLDGTPATQAYQQVYPKARSTNAAAVSAHHLLKTPKVAARLAELKAQQAISAQVSVDSLTQRLLRIATKAEAAQQHSAAVQGLQVVAKMHGFLIDKTQVDLVVRRPSASPDTPDSMLEGDWVKKYGIVDLLPEPQSPVVIDAEYNKSIDSEEDIPTSVSIPKVAD